MPCYAALTRIIRGDTVTSPRQDGRPPQPRQGQGRKLPSPRSAGLAPRHPPPSSLASARRVCHRLGGWTGLPLVVPVGRGRRGTGRRGGGTAPTIRSRSRRCRLSRRVTIHPPSLSPLAPLHRGQLDHRHARKRGDSATRNDNRVRSTINDYGRERGKFRRETVSGFGSVDHDAGRRKKGGARSPPPSFVVVGVFDLSPPPFPLPPPPPWTYRLVLARNLCLNYYF